MITPPPTPARLVKLRMKKMQILLSLSFFFSNLIIYINNYNLAKFGWLGGQLKSMPPRVALSLEGNPT